MERIEKMVKSRRIDLNPNDILMAEYEYITKTIIDLNDDRAKVGGFFNLVGTISTAMLGLIFTNNKMVINKTDLYLMLSGIFMIFTIFGTLTLSEIARLRVAWHESVQALNAIKDFYIKHIKEIEPAFKWRLKNLPPTDKVYSIANLMAVGVALLCACFSSAFVYFLLMALGSVEWWGWVLSYITLIAGYIATWAWYKHLLVDYR